VPSRPDPSAVAKLETAPAQAREVVYVLAAGISSCLFHTTLRVGDCHVCLSESIGVCRGAMISGDLVLHQPPEQISKRGLGKDRLGVLNVESLMLL
jgi:hypothetical protein